MELNNLQKGLIIFITICIISIATKNHYNNRIYLEVIEAFNKRDYKKLNEFISTKHGIFLAGYDGVYPLSSLDSNLNSENSSFWNKDSIFTNLELGSVKYIGNGKFKKEGAFLSSCNEHYIDDLNSVKEPLDDKSLEEAKNLELITKFKMEAVSKDNSKIYTFYFGVENYTNYLLAISYSPVPDFTTLNKGAKTLLFDNISDIKSYLNNKRFCNKEGAEFIDFNSKSLTNWRGNDVLYFNKIDIGNIEANNPGNVQQRTITFQNNLGEKIDNLVFTNNGEFIRWGRGVNAQINYIVCDNIKPVVNDKSTQVSFNIDSIIRNNNKSAFIKNLINTNGNNHFQVFSDTSNHTYQITNIKTKEQFSYSTYTESIEGYIFYTTKSINEIKAFYNRKGAKVDERNDFYLSTNCILVQLKEEGNMTKVEASWQCD